MIKSLVSILAALVCAGASLCASAQELATHFSCSQARDDHGLASTFADVGEIHFKDEVIEEFYWESTVYRKAYGIECSINRHDDLALEKIGDSGNAWRISLKDAAKSREARGYLYAHGFNCTIRLEREGDTLHIRPSCPALCGSRANFSELSVDLKTGTCKQEE